VQSIEEPRLIVARFLKRVRNFDMGECNAEVLAEIRKHLPNFQLWVEMGPESLADELDEYETGWAVLLKVCRSLPNVFDPDKATVRDLLKYLDQLNGTTGQQEKAINQIGDSRLAWPQAWPAAYDRTLDEPVAHDSQAVQTVAEAAGVLLRSGGEEALCKFLERLARLMDDGSAAQLRKLIETVAVLLKVDPVFIQSWRDEVAGEPLDVRPHILVRVDPQPDGSRMLSGWRYDSSRTAGELSVGLRDSRTIQFDDAPRGADEVQKVVVAALSKFLDAARNARGDYPGVRDDKRFPILQLMLPWEELETEVEAWPVPRADGHTDDLGLLLPVVVRPPANPTEPGSRHRHYRGWRDIHNGGGHGDRVFPWSDEHDEQSGKFGDDHRWLVLALTQSASRPRDAARVVRVAQVARGVGIPLVIWSLDGTDPRDIWNGEALRDLPYLAFAHRRRGLRVRVIWDDPFWVPEKHDLRWQSA